MPTGSDFARVDFNKQDQGSYRNHGDNKTGEFTEFNPSIADQDAAVYRTESQTVYRDYGYDPSNSQFSSNVDGDPKALDAAKTAGEDKFLAMQRLLQTTNYTLGSPICHGFESSNQQGETDQDPPYPGKR